MQRKEISCSLGSIGSVSPSLPADAIKSIRAIATERGIIVFCCRFYRGLSAMLLDATDPGTVLSEASYIPPPSIHKNITDIHALGPVDVSQSVATQWSWPLFLHSQHIVPVTVGITNSDTSGSSITLSVADEYVGTVHDRITTAIASRSAEGIVLHDHRHAKLNDFSEAQQTLRIWRMGENNLAPFYEPEIPVEGYSLSRILQCGPIGYMTYGKKEDRFVPITIEIAQGSIIITELAEGMQWSDEPLVWKSLSNSGINVIGFGSHRRMIGSPWVGATQNWVQHLQFLSPDTSAPLLPALDLSQQPCGPVPYTFMPQGIEVLGENIVVAGANGVAHFVMEAHKLRLVNSFHYQTYQRHSMLTSHVALVLNHTGQLLAFVSEAYGYYDDLPQKKVPIEIFRLS